MRWVVLVGLAGCHVGAGPVVGVSRGGLRLGAEAGGGVGPVGATVGGTTSVTSDEPRRFFATVDPALGVELDGNDAYDLFMAFGGTIGFSTNHGFGDHWALGMWAAPAAIKDFCDSSAPAYSVAVGFRVLGEVSEVFVAPKINSVTIPCQD